MVRSTFIAMVLAIVIVPANADNIFRDKLSGHWMMRGYNRILTIVDGQFQVNVVSRISCLPLEQGKAANLAGKYDRVLLEGKDHFSAFSYQGMTRYYFDRLEGLPASCGSEQLTGPVQTFDVLWQYFQENYAFFDERGIDWQQIRSEYRSRVSDQTTDAELFSVLSEVLSGFNDGHVVIAAGAYERIDDPVNPTPYFEAARESASSRVIQDFYTAQLQSAEVTRPLFRYTRKFLRQVVEHQKYNLLKGKYQSVSDDLILWGELAPGVGYLAVTSMSHLFLSRTDGTAAETVREVGRVLDQKIMPYLENFEAVILDVRFNGGGFDEVALEIASRFADKRRFAFTKSARDRSGVTPFQRIYIEPRGEQQYLKPVFLLTSSYSASATEIFTMATMPLPHITRVGETTNGILSDMLVLPLPNGWVAALSNEIYTAADGNLYEVTGIAPHFSVPVFVQDAFWDNVDRATDTVLELILKH